MTELEPGAELNRSGVALWTVDNANLRWISLLLNSSPCQDFLGLDKCLVLLTY